MFQHFLLPYKPLEANPLFFVLSQHHLPFNSLFSLRATMCRSSSSPNEYLRSYSFHLPWPSSQKHRKHHLLLHLNLLKRRRALEKEMKEGRERRRRRKVKSAEIEMKNLKLYMENQNIIEENERLRKKALLLHQENQVLFSQLQNKLLPQQQTTTKINPN